MGLEPVTPRHGSLGRLAGQSCRMDNMTCGLLCGGRALPPGVPAGPVEKWSSVGSSSRLRGLRGGHGTASDATVQGPVTRAGMCRGG